MSASRQFGGGGGPRCSGANDDRSHGVTVAVDSPTYSEGVRRSVLTGLTAAVLATTALVAQSARAETSWTPTPQDRLHIQFTGSLSVPDWATFVEIDGADSTAATVARLHAGGLHVACYISAGSAERWRSDYTEFPASVLGKRLDGWPGERWLDVRRVDILAPVMTARIDECAAKGFDAVEFDNVDGWTNDTGFPLTRRDARRYVRWLSDRSHEHGMAVGLKNALGLIRPLADHVDWALNEQCVQYDECRRYEPLVRRGKPVFVLEYSGRLSRICSIAARTDVIAQKKRLDLSSWSRPC